MAKDSDNTFEIYPDVVMKGDTLTNKEVALVLTTYVEVSACVVYVAPAFVEVSALWAYVPFTSMTSLLRLMALSVSVIVLV